MELLIKAKDIFAEYNGIDVLNIDELDIYEYDRIGLVGGNGAGKTTLLKALLGEITLPGCKINRLGQFAYIPQLEEASDNKPHDYALLGKLGVSGLNTQTMSGGEETRLKIAQALSEQVQGIFADEPTCHLDAAGIEFLIGQLQRFTGAVLVVSHDRYFLDKVVNKIWELKDGKITEYWGGYSDYLQQKEEQRQSQATHYEQLMAERERLERAAEEKRKQARKIDKSSQKNKSESSGRLGHQKTVGSKQKALHSAAKNMEQRIASLGNIEAPEKIRTIRFRQSPALELHNPYPIMITDLTKRFGERTLFDKISLQVPLGSKIAITGGNGVGKTVLFQMIKNREDGIYVSPKAEIGYFDQQGYKYNREQTVLSYLQEQCDYQVSEIRAVLAALGFKQSDISKRLAVLSGGEIIKLNLARLLMGRYNILLLDEPSNFLDLPSIEALEKLMQDYIGTILFVSHDKRLVENVADRVYELKEMKLTQKV